MLDGLVSNENDGVIPDDFEFTLYEHSKNGEIIETTCKGVWFMLGNDCLTWSRTIPPVKYGASCKAIHFSEWLESMIEDVECTFGVLKGRFCTLRRSLRFAKVSHSDKT